MNNSSIYKSNNSCLICGSQSQKFLGRRGNQEYLNAPKTEFHYVTNIVQCKDCTFIYCNPTITLADQMEKSHYNNSETYLDTESESYGKPYARGLKAISQFGNGGKLLDVGAGKGEFLELAKKSGFEVSGIEPSSEFCKYALLELEISIFCGSIFDYKNNSSVSKDYEYITLFHVLEHVKDPKGLLHELLPLFSVSGICYIEVPNSDSTLLRFADYFFWFMRKDWSSRLSPIHPPFHSIGYTKNALKKLFEITEYEVIDMWTFTGRDRGHQIRNRFSFPKRVIRNLVVQTLGIFPNKELIGVLVRPRKS